MVRTRDRRLAAILLLAAACVAAVASVSTWTGGATASDGGRRGGDSGDVASRDADLAAIRDRGRAKRVESATEAPAAADTPDAEAPEEPGPITETATLLAGAVRLVDADGVLARHREVRLLVKLLGPDGRRATLFSVDTDAGQFDVTFVRRGDGPFALENGSREIGVGPFEGRIEIFGAELRGREVSLGLLHEDRSGRLVPADRVAFDLRSPDATVFLRAPRTVTLDVVDAESGRPVGPISVKSGSQRGSTDVLARSRTSPLDVLLPSGDVDVLDVSVRGYADASLEVPASPCGVLRVEMERWATLTVDVLLDETDGDRAEAVPLHIEFRRVNGPPSARRQTLGAGPVVWTFKDVSPGTYIVTASLGGAPGFRIGSDGRRIPLQGGRSATRSIELVSGAREAIAIDLREGAPEVRSDITLALEVAAGEVLPSALEVSLQRISPAAEARTLRVAVPLGSAPRQVSLGEWPAGRYRADVMGGRAIVQFEHAAGATSTTVAVDLTQWVEWSVRLVRADTGEAALHRTLFVDVPGADGANVVTIPAPGGVFRFWSPADSTGCWVASSNGLRVRCALPPHGPGVLELEVPRSAIPARDEDGRIRVLLPGGQGVEPAPDGR